ncbi:fibrinogen-like protein A [Mizuhopecten yessoensis]|nr:fibrinogen-like protein A [Mizuhopecten yessoensis]
MTRSSKYVLVVELEDKDGVRGCASFDEFSIGPEGEGYRLDAWKYQGTAGNSLGYHTGNRFSTLDQDNDQRPSSIKNCADEYGGGGNWYKSCVVQNLNGLYLQLPGRADTMVWKTFRNFTGLKKSKMLLKKYSEVYD